MRTFGFGQSDNSIIQLAYVVSDLATAMEEWRTLLRIGPWFVLRQFAGLDPRYRGQPALARCDVAFGFAGHMQYELIVTSGLDIVIFERFKNHHVRW
jgi:hypothetical protein